MPSFKPEFSQLPQSVQHVVELLIKVSKPESIILFGSRARKTHRENSDFDFAIKSKKCSEANWIKLLVDIDDQPYTLFKLDIVEVEKVNPEYLKNIETDGVTIYG
jgi:uncharacterized protein